MKKTSKTFLATVGAVLSIALLGACSGGAAVQAEEDANFVGDWVLVEVEGNQEFADNMAMLEQYGATIVLAVGEDGTCSLGLDADSELLQSEEAIQPCTWEGKDKDKILVDFGQGEKAEAVLTDGKLALEADGDKVFFERVVESGPQS